MQKILVIGCPGSGKSTFARKLRDTTGLPLYYLDMIWHRPDQSTIPTQEFDPEFRQYILDFPKENLPQIYELLEKYGKDKNVFIFKSREESEAYLKDMLNC